MTLHRPAKIASSRIVKQKFAQTVGICLEVLLYLLRHWLVWVEFLHEEINNCDFNLLCILRYRCHIQFVVFFLVWNLDLTLSKFLCSSLSWHHWTGHNQVVGMTPNAPCKTSATTAVVQSRFLPKSPKVRTPPTYHQFSNNIRPWGRLKHQQVRAGEWREKNAQDRQSIYYNYATPFDWW